MSNDTSGTVPGSVYIYEPNRAASIFFAAAFLASGLFHVWQCLWYHHWKVTALLPFSCALLTAAFATRAYGAFNHYDDAQVYTASTLLMYMSPPLLQLSNFLLLARLFHFVPYFSPMHPSRMLVTFASLAAVIELLTIAGTAYLTNRDLPDKSLRVGDTLAKAALVVQLLVAGLFFLLAGIFHRCCRAGGIRTPRVTYPLVAAYGSMVLLVGRTVYRMVEHFGSPLLSTRVLAEEPLSLGPAVRYEWYFYVFDAALVLLAVVVWNVVHPGRFLPEDPRRYLAQDGVTVLTGPEWKDSRSLTETFFDPFAMLTTRGGHQKQFWEHNGYALGAARRGAGTTRRT
ncbi:hypothetical protein C8A01DRAFT_51446 [Parachaetomium inaequale]|uniref:Uncharacterized protein n=1 Tax=Parachaetomium inaequale TaxID=2588326 RepID=A0AAN6SLH4_9PEZI|nr:hypothetical protein C8A01DRAFT_51446 [Parachaetomium inaequale]